MKYLLITLHDLIQTYAAQVSSQKHGKSTVSAATSAPSRTALLHVLPKYSKVGVKSIMFANFLFPI